MREIRVIKMYVHHAVHVTLESYWIICSK